VNMVFHWDPYGGSSGRIEETSGPPGVFGGILRSLQNIERLLAQILAKVKHLDKDVRK